MLGAAAGSDPRSIVASADDTSSGDRRRSLGYSRSASLALAAATVEATTRPPSRPLTVTSRQPIRPGNDVSRNASSAPSPRAPVDDVESDRLQTTGAGSRDGSVLDDSKGQAPAVERQDEIACEGGRIVRAPELRAELVRRNLGDVERVPDVDVAAGDLDAGVAIDREVSERVRARRRRHRKQSGQDAAERNQDKCDAAPHRTGSHYASRRFVEAGPDRPPRMNVRPTCPSCCRSPTADPRCTGRIRAGSGRRH